MASNADFYIGLRGTADAMLREYGQAMTLRKRTPGAYDPATGRASVAETLTATVGVEIPMPERAIDGTSVLRGDKRVVLDAAPLAAAGVEPDAGDDMLVGAGAAVSRIIQVEKIAPAGITVIFTLQTRR